MPARILIVEDDENLRMALEDNLIDEGYAVTAVASGQAALAALEGDKHDLVVLDIMLPDIDGYNVCRQIRAKGKTTRVLMLTARTLENDLVEGFAAGADDYLSKPYRPRELLARIAALLRREVAIAAAPARLVKFAGYQLDRGARQLLGPSGEEIVLTRTELDLLACLLDSVGIALTREAILEQAWEDDVVVDPRTVDNFVSSLKKKLGWSQGASWRIATVRGVGYRMEVD